MRVIFKSEAWWDTRRTFHNRPDHPALHKPEPDQRPPSDATPPILVGAFWLLVALMGLALIVEGGTS